MKQKPDQKNTDLEKKITKSFSIYHKRWFFDSKHNFV
jgi:hypothetical protein